VTKLGRGAPLHLVARKGHTRLSSREPMYSVARSHAKPQPGYRSIPWSIERLEPRSRPRGSLIAVANASAAARQRS